ILTAIIGIITTMLLKKNGFIRYHLKKRKNNEKKTQKLERIRHNATFPQIACRGGHAVRPLFYSEGHVV
ncbi:MAG: hypothetical protein FWF54_08975, partial [Candidatus Azobacteroides sp.]|nr:hypothetical protein [Candidatus Azobacteroides sp.]